MGCVPAVWAPFALSVFTATCSAVLCVATVVGNCLICAAVIRDPFRQLRTPFTYFLVNLAVSDLIVGTVMLPISTYGHAEETTGYVQPIIKKLLHMSFFISATASIFSLMALSVDRFIAITFAIKYRMYLSWTRCFVLSCVIWILSLSLPFMYLKIGYVDYLMFYSHSAVVIVLIVLIATYIRIYTFLRSQTKEMLQVQRTTVSAAKDIKIARIKNEKRVTRTFLWILGMFIMTYVPAIIMIYILQFCTSCDCILIHALRDLQFLLISSNSCMNPFICTIRLRHFRKAIMYMLQHPCTRYRNIAKQSSTGSRKCAFDASTDSVEMGYANAVCVESKQDVKQISCDTGGAAYIC